MSTPANILTDEQLAFYNQNGFLVTDPVFDEGELVALREAADELLRKSSPIVRGNPRLQIEPETQDGELIVRKIEPIIDVVPAFRALATDERFTAPVAQVLGEPVILFEDNAVSVECRKKCRMERNVECRRVKPEAEGATSFSLLLLGAQP